MYRRWSLIKWLIAQVLSLSDNLVEPVLPDNPAFYLRVYSPPTHSRAITIMRGLGLKRMNNDLREVVRLAIHIAHSHPVS